MTEMQLPVDYTKLDRQTRRQVREQYIKEQKGLCWYCGELLANSPPAEVTNKSIDLSLFPLKFLKYLVHLQHDHDTGMTEGAVHAYCNVVLWQYHGR